MKRPTLLTRFMGKVEKTDNCWNWNGFVMPRGYGYFYHKNSSNLAHRTSYKLFKGEIPAGLTVDHLCKNRKCVNPDHLEAVTLQENQSRSNSMGVRNSKKSHCTKGHKLSGKNLFIKSYRTKGKKRTTRICRACRIK